MDKTKSKEEKMQKVEDLLREVYEEIEIDLKTKNTDWSPRFGQLTVNCQFLINKLNFIVNEKEKFFKYYYMTVPEDKDEK